MATSVLPFHEGSRLFKKAERTHALVAVGVLGGLCGFADAKDKSSGFSRDELRQYRRDFRQLGETFERLNKRLNKPEAEDEPPWKIDAGIGVLVSHTDSGGNTFNTPYFVEAARGKSRFLFTLKGDGWTRDSTSGTVSSGMADIRLGSRYVLPLASNSIAVGAALLIPTHGEVGAQNYQQIFDVVLTRKLAHFEWKGTVRQIHETGTLSPGYASWASSYSLGVDYVPTVRHTFSLAADRAVRRGADGAAGVSAAYAYQLSKPWRVSVLVNRALRTNPRSTTIGLEADYAWSR